jgi:hypothetical protein
MAMTEPVNELNEEPEHHDERAHGQKQRSTGSAIRKKSPPVERFNSSCQTETKDPRRYVDPNIA